MKPTWIDLVFYIPPTEKQWPTAAEWAYGIGFVLVFFVLVPWMMGS